MDQSGYMNSVANRNFEAPLNAIEEEKDQVDELDEYDKRMGNALRGNNQQTRKVSWAL